MKVLASHTPSGGGLHYRTGTYFGVKADPAAVQDVLAETRGTAHVVLARGCIDHLQPLIPNRPVHAEVGRLPGLPGLSITNA